MRAHPPEYSPEGERYHSEDACYEDAVDAEGPPPERITERDMSPYDLDPRESLDDPPPVYPAWRDPEMEE